MSKRTTNITYQEVAIAIEALLIKGSSITYTNVRRELAEGYPLNEFRGSPQKVGEYIKEYRDRNDFGEAFREKHLSPELSGAIVAEIKKHMFTYQEQFQQRLIAAEVDRDHFLLEWSKAEEQRDALLEKIETVKISHAQEIKGLEVEAGILQERAERWEKECAKSKVDLDDLKKLLEEKVGQLAVATEQAKPANELRARLDAAEQKNAEYFSDLQKKNEELIATLKKKAELELDLLSLENSSNRQKLK